MFINCDMGESYGHFQIGNDDAIFPYIDACNIACGFHGGDPYHIDQTIQKAVKYHVRIGAHPSYPDLMGFGRQKMNIQPKRLTAIIKYQVGALKSMVESHGAHLEYVKPHGALYNSAAQNEQEANAIIEALISIDAQLMLMGLAGSILEKTAQKIGYPFIAEAFADRHYQADGQLVPRSHPQAVIHDPLIAVKQVTQIQEKQSVTAIDGTIVPIHAQSCCIHGDNQMAVAILTAIQANRTSH